MPTIKNNDGTLEVVEPEKTTTETTTQYYGSDLITTETVKNADGQVITETIKDKDGNVTNIANYTYGEDGSRTIKNTDVDGNLKSEYTYDKNDRITKGVEYKDGKETKITTINWTDDSINGARTAIIEDREAGTIMTNVMDSTGKQISQVITDLDGNVISSEAKMTTEEAKEKIADLSDRNGYVSEDDYQKRVSDEVLKNLTADQIKELNTTDNGYGHSYLWSYSTRLNALGYDQALTTLKGYGLTEDQSTKILDALSISKTPVSITPEVTDPPPSSGSVDTSEITPEESIIINGKLDLIDEYLNNENYEGSVSNSRALADELLNMDSALLAKIAKSYNAIHSGKDFASDMFNFYMDNDNDNHKFKNFDKQLALAKKLFPVQTGTLTEEQKQQALTVAQDCLSIIQINNGVWADDNKKDFIANLKSLTPEQIALVQQTFDSQIAQWYPVSSIPGMDKDTSTFKFADMVKKYLSSNWVGGGKWNDQSPELMKLLAQSGII